ncbi:hypothetical protein G6F65_014916 [Rhizopus arrhizus]|nr:hypothetical protein G6F65_014916 [Rhizopus arrhizus]
MASVSPAAEAHAILRAPDLESAERAYLGLMPDLEHVNALARRALGLSRVADAARGYALSMTLVGLRLQELEMACARPSTPERRVATAHAAGAAAPRKDSAEGGPGQDRSQQGHPDHRLERALQHVAAEQQFKHWIGPGHRDMIAHREILLVMRGRQARMPARVPL